MFLAEKKTPKKGEMDLGISSMFQSLGSKIHPSPQPKTKFLPKCPRIIKCYACKWDKDDWKHRKEVMLGRESSFVWDWQLPFPPFKEILSK